MNDPGRNDVSVRSILACDILGKLISIGHGRSIELQYSSIPDLVLIHTFV